MGGKKSIYRGTISPQAILFPEFPLGCVVKSSGLS